MDQPARTGLFTGSKDNSDDDQLHCVNGFLKSHRLASERPREDLLKVLLRPGDLYGAS